MDVKKPVGANSALQENLQNLQDLVITQASRLINDNLYTKSLLSFLPVALLSTDKGGNLQVANKAAEEMLQTSLKSIKGDSLTDLFSHSPDLIKQIELASSKQVPISADSVELILADGQKKIVNIHIRMFYDEERRMFGTLLALEDQTYISFLRESFKKHAATPPTGEIIAQSPKSKQAVKKIDELALQDGPVLLSGPPGSGKTFFGAKLHNLQGSDDQAPLILLDCNTVDSGKFREMLLGSKDSKEDASDYIRFKSLHNYGTIHLAEGGSLLLLNIDALSSENLETVYSYVSQVADGSPALPKCRVIATTNMDIGTLKKRENFSKPLLDLLLKNCIEIPPLSKRRKDILPLARLFLSSQDESGKKHFTRGAENALLSKQYNQHNVKELKDAIELAALVAESDTIRSEHIFTGPLEQATDHEIDLTDIPLTKFLIGDKSLSILRGAVLVFFTTLIGLTLFVPDSLAGIIGNDLVWGAWWIFLVFGFLLLGRIWCTICPLSTAGRIASRMWHFAKAPPTFIKKSSPFLIPIGFAAIIWFEQVFHMTVNPEPTGYLLITLIVLAIIFAMLFERETWCRYLCPLGNFGGIFALSATLFVRSTPNVCATKCTTHNCNKGSDEYAGCPVFHHPLFAKNAHNCKLCFNCLKSCPHGSARLYLRPPLVRIWKQLDIEETVGYFAFVFFFISPFLLASEQIPQLMEPLALTGGIVMALILAAMCRYTFPKMLFAKDQDGLLSTTRLSLVLLLLAWGPFAAFQFGHISGVESLLITSSSPEGLFNSGFLNQGVPLLSLMQLSSVWFGAFMGTVTLLALGWNNQEGSFSAQGGGLYYFISIVVLYAILSTWIIS